MISKFAFNLLSINLIFHLLAFFQLFTDSTSSPATSTSLQKLKSSDPIATEKCIESCLYPLVFLTKSFPTTETKPVEDLCTSLDKMKICLQGCSVGAETLPTMARLVLHSYYIMNQLCHATGIGESLMLESPQDETSENKPDDCLSSCERQVQRTIVEGGSTLQVSEICHIWANYEQCALDCPQGEKLLSDVKADKPKLFEEIEDFCGNARSVGSMRRRMLESNEGPDGDDSEDADENQKVQNATQSEKIQISIDNAIETASKAKQDECRHSCESKVHAVIAEGGSSTMQSTEAICQIWVDYQQCVNECPEGEEILAHVEKVKPLVFEKVEDICGTEPVIGSMRRRMLPSYEAPDANDAGDNDEQQGGDEDETRSVEKESLINNNASNETFTIAGNNTGTNDATTSGEIGGNSVVSSTETQNVNSQASIANETRSTNTSHSIETTQSTVNVQPVDDSLANNKSQRVKIHNKTISNKYPENITKQRRIINDPDMPTKKALKSKDKHLNDVSMTKCSKALSIGCLILAIVVFFEG